MAKMHLNQPGPLLVDHLLEIKKEFKNEIQIIFTRMNWIKLAFNMIYGSWRF